MEKCEKCGNVLARLSWKKSSEGDTDEGSITKVWLVNNRGCINPKCVAFGNVVDVEQNCIFDASGANDAVQSSTFVENASEGE